MTSFHDDFQALTEKAEAESTEAYTRNPRSGDFGMLVSGDASPAIGGGFQAFMWFESRNAFLAFMEKYGFLIHPPLNSLDLNALRDFARSIARRIRLNEVSDEEAPDALTEGLRGVTRFHWIGSFDSLAGEDSPFALQIRQQFRDISDDRPIDPDEHDDFMEFLSLYGT